MRIYEILKKNGEGKIKGNITKEPRGKNGFGFDEIFEYNNKTLAELSPTEKNNLSARKIAAEEIKRKLERWWYVQNRNT